MFEIHAFWVLSSGREQGERKRRGGRHSFNFIITGGAAVKKGVDINCLV